MTDWIIENQSKYEIIGIDNLNGVDQNNIFDKITSNQTNIYTENLNSIFKQDEVVFVYQFTAYASDGLS